MRNLSPSRTYNTQELKNMREYFQPPTSQEIIPAKYECEMFSKNPEQTRAGIPVNTLGWEQDCEVRAASVFFFSHLSEKESEKLCVNLEVSSEMESDRFKEYLEKTVQIKFDLSDFQLEHLSQKNDNLIPQKFNAQYCLNNFNSSLSQKKIAIVIGWIDKMSLGVIF
jgi:hypothetical protein